VNLRAEELFEMGFEKVCGLEKAFFVFNLFVGDHLAK